MLMDRVSDVSLLVRGDIGDRRSRVMDFVGDICSADGRASDLIRL